MEMAMKKLGKELYDLKNDRFFRKTAFMNLIFTCAVVILVMSCAVFRSIRIVDQNITMTISSISSFLAEEEAVQKALEQGKTPERLQENLDHLIEKTEYIDIITIADLQEIRIYHPSPDKIGEKFQGGDANRFTPDTPSYLTTGQGTLGYQRRAFTQVLDADGNAIGFVMVSSLVSNIYQNYWTVLYSFIPLTLLILMAAVVLSGVIAYQLRKSLLGHNPAEFVRLFIQRNEMFDALEEGILAVDSQGKILFANQSAARIYQTTPEQLQGNAMASVLPTCRLNRVLKTGEAEYGREIPICGQVILCDRIPLREKERITGALSIYRNKTEVTRMAEELTGVQHIVEALRSNMHEFKNHLHIILGMVQLKEYHLVEQYINGLNTDSMMLSAVIKCIENKTLAALIYGKIGQAREQGITMTIESSSYLPATNPHLTTNQLITILGNLLQNAIEATQVTGGEQEIELFVCCSSERIKIVVDDTGCGILPEDVEKVTRRGFSTKGKDRGIGMDLVWAIVQEKNGDLIIDSEPGEGSSITVEICAKAD